MDLPDAIDAVRPSVVQISGVYTAIASFRPGTITFDPILHELLGGRPSITTSIGTGFFVNDQAYVVTAQHVIEAVRSLQQASPAGLSMVGVGVAFRNTDRSRAGFETFPFDIIDEDTWNDLALLRLRHNPFVRYREKTADSNDPRGESLIAAARLATGRPRDGSPLAVSGYPLNEKTLVTTTGIIASSWAIKPNPKIAVDDVYLADVQTNPGNSGGPAYSTVNGAVIGVLVAAKLAPIHGGGQVVAGLGADSGVSVIVPSKYVCELLDRNRVAYIRAG